MNKQISTLFSQVPAKPEFNPVKAAIENSNDMPNVAAALKHFASMPPSTGVFANPVRHRLKLPVNGESLELDIRSFAVRGRLLEEDIVHGDADAVRVIFTGLFDRVPNAPTAARFGRFIANALDAGLNNSLKSVADFMKRFPNASPDIVMQHWASIRKAMRRIGEINVLRPPDKLLAEMIEIHMENVAAAAMSSYMRSLKPADRLGKTARFIHLIRAMPDNKDPFRLVFSLLLRRVVNDDEVRILGRLGAIQVHHGSAGSSMVARYFASLHTRSVSDLFTASQMTLDCGRHFGAISDMTDFVRSLESTPEEKRDDMIRARILTGNLPTFGHPEISAAGRDNHLEADPRPALYLAPLFDAIDRGVVRLSARVQKRFELVARIYRIALFEGIEKSSGKGRLRLTPNTDFGAWLVQEALGIEETDRTLLSYTYRGFGWMMDTREQLQQPIIRPVIPPDPAIIPPDNGNETIPKVIADVHSRLISGSATCRGKEFRYP
jgi:citrate synthase